MSSYILSTKQYDDGQFIHFHNTTDSFVEVVFTVNGREVREHGIPTKITRGYGFAPKLDKSVRKRSDETLIPLHEGDRVEAYIFTGTGAYKEADLDKPTFLRHKLVDRFSFRRSSDIPVEVLKISVSHQKTS